MNGEKVPVADDEMELATLSGASSVHSSPASMSRRSKDSSLVRLRNLEETCSSSEDEEEVQQKLRLEVKNPMFPKLY